MNKIIQVVLLLLAVSSAGCISQPERTSASLRGKVETRDWGYPHIVDGTVVSHWHYTAYFLSIPHADTADDPRATVIVLSCPDRDLRPFVGKTVKVVGMSKNLKQKPPPMHNDGFLAGFSIGGVTPTRRLVVKSITLAEE